MNRLWLVVCVSAAHLLAGSSCTALGQLLIRDKIFSNPETWVLNKGFANSQWNKDLYCQPTSSGLAYVADANRNLSHMMDIETDACWNRLIYTDQTIGQQARIREYGEFGDAVGGLYEPMAMKVVSQTSDASWYLPYYHVYVADRGNHRVEKLRYRWTTPDSGLIHMEYYTSDMWRPTDLDVSNNGSFTNIYGYYTWVACKSDKIYAFWDWNGAQVVNYGSTGSGTGQFSDIRAIVCGKTRQNAYGTWFANNNFVYVLDAGNQRIVRLQFTPPSSIAWDMEYSNPKCAAFTDLEVDACGHIWATSSENVICKFTSDLQPLGVFGRSGTGPNQFDNPVSIANTGGHLGGGDMVICENWTTQSGLQHYVIGTDVTNIFVNTQDSGSVCYSKITFLLAEYSQVTIAIKNAGGTIIRHLDSASYSSGVHLKIWDGKNDSGVLMPWDSYRVEIIAECLYTNASGQPTNTVMKSTGFTLCEGSCNWIIGDANGDGYIDISDAVYLIQYIFAGGATPMPGAGDADCSRSVDISDPVFIINYAFAGGPEPGNPDGIPPPDCTCSDYTK